MILYFFNICFLNIKFLKMNNVYFFVYRINCNIFHTIRNMIKISNLNCIQLVLYIVFIDFFVNFIYLV